MYVLVCLGYVGIAGIHVCISVSRVCWYCRHTLGLVVNFSGC